MGAAALLLEALEGMGPNWEARKGLVRLTGRCFGE